MTKIMAAESEARAKAVEALVAMAKDAGVTTEDVTTSVKAQTSK